MTIQWPLLGFEIGILFTAIFTLIADLILPEERKNVLGYAAAIGVIVSGVYNVSLFGHWGFLFGGTFTFDQFAWYFKMIVSVGVLVAILLSRQYIKNLARGRGEFFLLMLLASIGMSLIVSARDFLLLFLGIELMTVSFYVMAAYLRSHAESVEAGLKYLILGGLASACLVFGIAFIYGGTGGTSYQVASATKFGLSYFSTFGVFMVATGLLFKVAAFPFHFWVPDVYEGAPTPVTAFLSVGSKAAAFGAFARFISEAGVSSLAPISLALAGLAALTVCYGNLVAIPQTSTKRLLAYSSIGHAGYLLMGLAMGSALGLEGLAFYILAYAFSNLAAWVVVFIVEESTGSARIENFAGLSQRSPLLSSAMFIALLSLAGVPPLAGFFGKFIILLSVVEQGYLWLAIVGVVMIVVSLYYYLLVIKKMYIHEPTESAPIAVPLTLRAVLYVLMVGIVVIGVFQGPFFSSAQAAVSSLFR